MDVIYTTLLLALLAFGLGACPFSLWIGHWRLGKDVRQYGDGNPGAINVFRAGSRKWGTIAMLLDIAKGIPFVMMAHKLFELPEASIIVIALSAILGHAFSPLLRFKGGKALAVTGGVLLALPQLDMFFALALFMFLGLLFIETDAWTVISASVATLIYLVVTKGSSWEPVLMSGILAILLVKHFKDLRNAPGFKIRLISWLRSKRAAS